MGLSLNYLLLSKDPITGPAEDLGIRLNLDHVNMKEEKKLENENGASFENSRDFCDGIGIKYEGENSKSVSSSLSHCDNNNILSSERLDNETKIFEFLNTETTDENIIINNDKINNTNNSLSFHIPSLCDMLIGFPTQKGFIAYRKPEIGSWYMNAIVQVFSKHAHDTDLCAMLNMVNSIISNEVTNTGKKQMSEYTCKLTKPYFHFFPGMIQFF